VTVSYVSIAACQCTTDLQFSQPNFRLVESMVLLSKRDSDSLNVAAPFHAV
jgi:hypothetical protein